MTQYDVTFTATVTVQDNKLDDLLRALDAVGGNRDPAMNVSVIGTIARIHRIDNPIARRI